MNQNQRKQRGVELLFLAQVFAAATSLAAILPLPDGLLNLVSLASIAGLVLMVAGLNTLRTQKGGYRWAYRLTIGELVLAFLGGTVSAFAGMMVSVAAMLQTMSLVSIFVMALELAAIYLCCGGTMELIRPIAPQAAEQGSLIRVLVLVVLAASVASLALDLLSLGAASFVALLASILQVVCAAYFARFLFQCRKLMGAVPGPGE